MNLQREIEQLSQDHLDAIMRLMHETVARASPRGSSLVEMTDYHMRTGGKRLRALLPLAVARALGHDPAPLIPFGAACEMLHNATLVHDDLQDGDTVRRDQPTAWVRYGEARAINLGDAMLYYTLALVGGLDADAATRQAITARVVTQTLRVVDGQEREFLLKEQERPTLDAYIAMVEGKTSGLFALPVAGAAALCGAPEAVVDALERASGHLGVLFQIQDDVLDLFADKGRERRGCDIAEGKISILVVHALEHASAQDARWLRDVLRAGREHVSDAQIVRAITLLHDCGAARAAFDEIDRRSALAINDPALIDAPGLRALLEGCVDVFLAPIRGVRESVCGA